MIFRLFPETLVFNAVLCHHSSPPKSVIVVGIFIISYPPYSQENRIIFPSLCTEWKGPLTLANKNDNKHHALDPFLILFKLF